MFDHLSDPTRLYEAETIFNQTRNQMDNTTVNFEALEALINNISYNQSITLADLYECFGTQIIDNAIQEAVVAPEIQ